MIEDKLTADQRVRLEALNQAVQSSLALRPKDEADLLRRAKVFHDYIKDSAFPRMPESAGLKSIK